jgi:long-chain acyl-CoA synthetase
VGQTYGLTEAGGVVSTGVGADIASHPGSSGRLAPVVEVRVDNPDSNGNGELLFRSPAAMDGYWGVPNDGTVGPDGWIRTGDLGHVDHEGFLYVTGRAKDVIIRGGENVAAVRVESVLRMHPAVAEVAVIGLPDPDLGEIVAAIVEHRPSYRPTAAELESFAAESLARFAVPARWWIRSQPLPVNDAGKILKRHLLRDWLAEEANGGRDAVSANAGQAGGVDGD